MVFLVKYIVVFLSGLAIAWGLVPFLKRISPALGLVDKPSERRIHTKPVPRSGGIAVFAGTHLALLVAFLGPWGNLAGNIHLKEWGFLFLGSLLVLMLGLVDDRFGMRAWVKLGGQLGVALIMFLGGFSFGAFLGVHLPLPVDVVATLFWITLFINAFNLIDGMDGACAGLGLISGAGLAGFLISLRQPADAIVLAAFAGACLGFLRFNFNPASVFLGDCGSMFIGFMLAAVSLKANVKQSMMVALLVPLLAIGVPVFDVILAVWRRLARKLVARIRNDKLACKIFGPDLDHIHHKLLRGGMTQRKAAICLYGAAIFLCLLALGFTALNSNRTAILLVGMMVVLHVVVRQLAHVELWTTTQVVLQGVRRPRHMVGMLVGIGWDLLCLLAATFFVFGLVLVHRAALPLILITVLIPFAALYFYGIYKTVWTRSRISQMLVLALQLLAGEVLAFAALLWVTDLDRVELLEGLILHFLCAAAGIVGIRAAFRIVRDLGAWLRSSIGPEYDSRTLLLGAGENAILYLRQAAFADQQLAARKIVGMIDDNPALQGNLVYGHPVLGGFDQLEEIVRKYDVNEIIFTHHYNRAIRSRVLALKSGQGLLVREFVFALHDLNDEGKCQGLVKSNSVHEVECRHGCAMRGEPNAAQPVFGQNT